MDLQSANTYREKYEKCEEMGRGKFGVVFRVVNKETGKVFAAKHIRARKPEMKAKVMEEIAIVEPLYNPHIIRFIEAFQASPDIIILTEFLEGGELFEKVATEDFNLTESDCCLFMRQICRGVEYLHNNSVVHLDLKPENIVCVQKDTNYTNVKIIDFGTAKKLVPGEQIRVMCGTPEFVAPEVVSYDVISTGTDMWSVGVICYILLSGFSPFMGENDADTYNNIVKVVYDFEEPEFDFISKNAKEFISLLLMKRPRNRIGAKQCLDHPWLMEKDIGSAVIDTSKLRQFLARRRWQRCGSVIRAMKRMSGMMIRRRSSSDSLGLSRSCSNDSISSIPHSPQSSRKNSDRSVCTPTKETNPIVSSTINFLKQKVKDDLPPFCPLTRDDDIKEEVQLRSPISIRAEDPVSPVAEELDEDVLKKFEEEINKHISASITRTISSENEIAKTNNLEIESATPVCRKYSVIKSTMSIEKMQEDLEISQEERAPILSESEDVEIERSKDENSVRTSIPRVGSVKNLIKAFQTTKAFQNNNL